ncbi:MAG: hypothetical protein GY856_20445 [bacterium]|nr:hypothetical protein [bacterium]
MADQYVEVTTESWGKRLGDSIKGILVGVFLVIVGIVLLFWNEGRAVKRTKTLKEGGGAVVSVEAASLDSAHESHLVHFTGEATTAQTLADPEFGRRVQALKLVREVEMYQWVEEVESKEKKKVGGGTETTKTYTYDTKWSSGPVDSDRFKDPEGHSNPPFEFDDRQWVADTILVGAFTLSAPFTSQLTRSEKIELTEEDLPTVPPALAGRLLLDGGSFYLGESPKQPQVGDLQIHFRVVRPAVVTVVGQQQGNQLVPYQTQVGGTITLLEYGTLAAEVMFEKAQSANVLRTWLLRLGGFLMIFIGFAMILRPLSVVADVLPFVGNLVEKGTGLIAFVAACLVSLVTIAVGWIFYRPLLGIGLLVVAVCLVVWLVTLGRKRKAAAPAAAPPPPAAAAPPPPPPS